MPRLVAGNPETDQPGLSSESGDIGRPETSALKKAGFKHFSRGPINLGAFFRRIIFPGQAGIFDFCGDRRTGGR